MKRYFYAGKSYMGTNFTYDSACWSAYRFETKKERDEWVSKNEYRNGNLVAEKITPAIMKKIIGYKSSKFWNSEILENDNGELFFYNR